MTALPAAARPGPGGLDDVARAWAAWLVRFEAGVIGRAYAGFQLDQGAAHEDIGSAFGQLGSELQRLWWQDVFDEPMPSPGSTHWRRQLVSLEMPPPDRGPSILLEDGAHLLLDGDDDARLRRA